ncbi:MAG: DUF937 domain-containing protein [Rhodospirillales bacterium]|nr:DUF937 domain-containing protein [Rhodospirillales bacterium]
MSLMDILNGLQNGPLGAGGLAGGAASGPASGSRGGMSPMTMALLALLAYKAIKGFGSSPAQAPSAAPGGALPTGLGLDEILGRLGGGQGDGVAGGQTPGGGLLGGLLSGGLGDLLAQFQGAGKGDAANSWIGTGQNQPIAPHELSQVITPEQMEFLTQRTGLARGELLAGLSEQLPQLVDRLTPDGRLPTADEMIRTA